MNNKEKKFIHKLIEFFPERIKWSRWPKSLSKEILIPEIFRRIRYWIPYRDLKHWSTCHAYIKELQRRGYIKKLLDKTKASSPDKGKIKKLIVDSTNILSYRINRLVNFSGKSHNYCFKISIAIDDNYIVKKILLSQWTLWDSKILDKMFQVRASLPKELFLDNWYEKYSRRREYKGYGCQIRMPMKRSYTKNLNCKKVTNRKPWPKFRFSREHKIKDIF